VPCKGSIVDVQLDVLNSVRKPSYFSLGLTLRNAVFYWLGLNVTPEMLISDMPVDLPDLKEKILIFNLFDKIHERMAERRKERTIYFTRVPGFSIFLKEGEAKFDFSQASVKEGKLGLQMLIEENVKERIIVENSFVVFGVPVFEFPDGRAVFIGANDYEWLFHKKPRFLVKTRIFPIDVNLKKVYLYSLLKNIHLRNFVVQFPEKIDVIQGAKRLTFADENGDLFFKWVLNLQEDFRENFIGADSIDVVQEPLMEESASSGKGEYSEEYLINDECDVLFSSLWSGSNDMSTNFDFK
jgi:hypothetical protein